MINHLEKEFLKLPQVECQITHRFGPGIYIRERSAPAGALIIGHEHKTEHTCVLLKGRMRFFLNGKVTDIKAPCIFVAQPGRKMSYQIEDSVFLNIHTTTETDLTKLEELLIVKSEGWTAHQLEENKKVLLEEAKCLG